MARAKFPVLWTLLLIFGLGWLVNELGYYTINIPWGPVIVVVLAIGLIVNRYR